MHVDTIREALHQQPFQPFILRVADGRSFLVPHRDYVAVSPRRVVVINPIDEAMSILEPLLIVSIEFAGTTQSAAPGGNGS